MLKPSQVIHFARQVGALASLCSSLFLAVAAPANAAGLLGGVAGAANLGGAAGVGSGGIGGVGSPLGGLTGAAGGSGMLGATLGANGLPTGPSATPGPLSRVSGAADGVRTGRAWGTFEEVRGGAKQRSSVAKGNLAKIADRAPKGPLAGGGGSSGARSALGRDGFALSRSFELPGAPASANAEARSKGKASASGSASARNAKVAGYAEASAEAKASR